MKATPGPARGRGRLMPRPKPGCKTGAFARHPYPLRLLRRIPLPLPHLRLCPLFCSTPRRDPARDQPTRLCRSRCGPRGYPDGALKPNALDGVDDRSDLLDQLFNPGLPRGQESPLGQAPPLLLFFLFLTTASKEKAATARTPGSAGAAVVT